MTSLVSPAWQPIELVEFTGIVDIVEADTPSGIFGAFEAKNVEFLPSQVGCRDGLRGILYNALSAGVGSSLHTFDIAGITWIVSTYSSSGLTIWPLTRVFDRQSYNSGGVVERLSCIGRSLRFYTAFNRGFSTAPPTPVVASYVGGTTTGATIFTGTGLNDGTITVTIAPQEPRHYVAVIDGTGTPDTFKWSDDGGLTFLYTGIAITGAAQDPGSTGVSIQFGATTGHTLNDQWSSQLVSFVVDYVMQGPYTYTPSAPTEPGAGIVTPGVHYFGYIIQHRGGFIGRPSPDSGVAEYGTYRTFQPVAFTATGGASLQWVLNPTLWPLTAEKVMVVMSPVSDKNRFFIVPGTETAVPGGTSSSKTIAFNIDDATLIARGIEATDQLSLLTANGTASTTGTEYGTPPFKAYHVSSYGDRAVWLYIDSTLLQNTQLAVSERNKPETLVAPDCFINPNRSLTTSVELLGRLYLFSHHYTGWTEDNGLTPAEWPQINVVSDSIGTSSLHGVAVSADGTYAWVLSQSGLYLLTASGYSEVPISYWQTGTWDTLDWSLAADFKVVDDAEKRVVKIHAVNTNGTYLTLCFDYSRGRSPNSVRMYQMINTGIIQESVVVTNIRAGSLTVSSRQAAVPIGRQSIYRVVNNYMTDSQGYDVGGRYDTIWTIQSTPPSQSAIDHDYQPVMPPGGSDVYMAHALRIAVVGSGTLTPVLYDKDKVNSFSVGSITLATSPGVDYFRECQQISELFSMRFRTNTVGTWFRINYLNLYYSLYARSR